MFHLYLKNDVGGNDFDPDYVDYILDRYKDQEVHVLISSLGGSLNAGMRINNAFRLHGQVHVHLMGMNASAATIASLGAQTISIDPEALYLIHQCAIPILEFATLNADELTAKIEELKKTQRDLNTLDLTIANMYARRAGDQQQAMLNRMKKAEWLTSGEVFELNLVDCVTTVEQKRLEPTKTNIEDVTNYYQQQKPQPMNYEFPHLTAAAHIDETALPFTGDMTSLTLDECNAIENVLAVQEGITKQIEALKSIKDHLQNQELNEFTIAAEFRALREKITQQETQLQEAQAQLQAAEAKAQTELQEVQAKLQEAQAQLQSRAETISALEKRLADLPAAATAQVLQAPTAESDEFLDSFARAQALYNSVP